MGTRAGLRRLQHSWCSPIENATLTDTLGRRLPPYAVIAGAFVAVTALVFGIRYLAYAATHQTTDDAKIDADTVTITSKIIERVDRILIDTNQPVRKGQVLIRLDDRDERTRFFQAQVAIAAQRAQARVAQQNVALTREQQRAQVAQGMGNVLAAREQIATATANYRAQKHNGLAESASLDTAQAQLRVAEDQVPSAKAMLLEANADLARYNSLAGTGDVSRQQLDEARATEAQAQAQYFADLDKVTSAKAAVAQSQAQLTSALAAARAAQASVEAQHGQLDSALGSLHEVASSHRIPQIFAQFTFARAQTSSTRTQSQTARDQLSDTIIRSPIDGVVGMKNVEIGSTVTPGQALMQIVPRRIFITANYKETQLDQHARRRGRRY